MNWFRLYSEARNDAKLRTLSDAEHRVWFNLLCYAAEQKPCRGSIVDFDMDILAIEVANGDTDLLLDTLKKLSRLRIVRATQGSEITFLKFEDRQYDKPSDRPASVKARVQAHRDKEKAGVTPPTDAVTGQVETLADENGNAMKRDVTPSNAHTQKILRTEQNRTEDKEPPIPPEDGGDAPAPTEGDLPKKRVRQPRQLPRHNPEGFVAVWEPYPKHEDRLDAVKEWDAAAPTLETVNAMLSFIAAAKETDRWRRGMVKALGRFIRGQTYLDDLASYQDRFPTKAANGSTRPPQTIPAMMQATDDALADMPDFPAEGGRRPRAGPDARHGPAPTPEPPARLETRP